MASESREVGTASIHDMVNALDTQLILVPDCPSKAARKTP
jgi:hypothetical protein